MLINTLSFQEWFEKTYEENFERLYRYAFAITKDKLLAEDVVSELFLNIWRKKPDYSSIRELKSYLHVSVKHLALRQLSKDLQHYCSNEYEEAIEIADAVDPENLLLAKELEDLVNHVLAGLSMESQIVYSLSRTKGYSNQQIADEIGISKRTVESHLYLVIRRLKEKLEEHLNRDGAKYPHFYRVEILLTLVICTLFLS